MEKKTKHKARYSQLSRKNSDPYTKLCSSHSILPSSKLQKCIRAGEIKLNIDSIEKPQLFTLAESLKHLKSIRLFSLWSSSFDMMSSVDISNSSPVSSVPVTPRRSASKPKQKQNSRNPSTTFQLLKGLSDHLKVNTSLKELKLSGLSLSAEVWTCLNLVLQFGSLLETLSIQKCGLNDEYFQSFTHGLLKCYNLKKLDLPDNLLENGFHLGRTLCKLSYTKDKNDERPGKSKEKGLEIANLSFNKLNDKAVIELCSEILHSNSLRSIDFRSNHFGEEGHLAIVNFIQNNRNILHIDVRNTQYPGWLVHEKLANNIKMSKLDKQTIESYRTKLKETKGRKKTILTAGNSPSRKTGFHRQFACANCKEHEKNLTRSEKRCIELTVENTKLKQQLQELLSGPNLSIANFVKAAGAVEESEVLSRIEMMMAELTKLMDGIESSQTASNSVRT